MTNLSPEAKALFKEARASFEPSDERKRRVHAAALGAAAGSTLLASPTAAASKLFAGAGITLGKSLLLIGVALSLAGGAWLALSGPEAVRGPMGPALRHAPVAVPAPLSEPSAVLNEQASPRAAESAPLARRAEPPAKSASASNASGAPVSGSDTLAEQVSVMRQARQALQAGAPARALALLEGYGARYPGSVLREEELALRALSLCGLGRVAEASRVTERLETLSPRSPQLERVKRSCAGKTRTGN